MNSSPVPLPRRGCRIPGFAGRTNYGTPPNGGEGEGEEEGIGSERSRGLAQKRDGKTSPAEGKPHNGAEDLFEVHHFLLELFARKSARKDYLGEVIRKIAHWADCRCAGIRILDDYGNIPYEAYTGFNREFWESENHLSIHRDQCSCIRVIAEIRESQDFAHLTPWGSFYCNNTRQFVEGLTEQERARYRGTCLQHGFLSVAIIPLRYRDKILGAFHLADEKPGKVPRGMVEFIEDLTPLIGEAVHRFNLEEEIQRKHETQKIMNVILGLSLQEISLGDLVKRGLETLLSVSWLGLEPRGALFLTEGHPPVLTLKGSVGLPEPMGYARPPIPEEEPFGRAMRDQEIRLIQGEAKGAAEIEEFGPHGFYCLPLLWGDGLRGLITLAVPEGYLDHEAKKEFLTHISRVFAASIFHKEAEERIQDSEKKLRALSLQILNAQEMERKRIAQELHDSIGQVLAAVKYGVENIFQQIDRRKNQKAAKTLHTATKLIHNAVKEVRRMSSDLRPSMLDDLGIQATLNWFLREFGTIYSRIRLEKAIDVREEEIPEPLKTVIYRVVQEAMNNVAKHSGADRASLLFRSSGKAIELAVEDNGAGFDLSHYRAGVGLASMRERVENAGGSFSLETEAGKGTIVRALWPIKS